MRSSPNARRGLPADPEWGRRATKQGLSTGHMRDPRRSNMGSKGAWRRAELGKREGGKEAGAAEHLSPLLKTGRKLGAAPGVRFDKAAAVPKAAHGANARWPRARLIVP